MHFHNSRWMIQVGPKDTEVFGGCFNIDYSVIFGVLSRLKAALGNGAIVKQEFGAIKLNLSQFFVLDRLAIVGVGACNIGTSDLEKKLTFFYVYLQGER